MSYYTSIDLIRFKKFAEQNPEMNPMELIKAYNKQFPRLTPKQKIENAREFLKASYLKTFIK